MHRYPAGKEQTAAVPRSVLGYARHKRTPSTRPLG